MTDCLNCGTALNGNKYCGSCGQKNLRRKLSLIHILIDTWTVITDVDNRWIRAFRDAMVRPGAMAADYVNGMRSRYASPMQYFLVVMAIALFIAPSIEFFNIDEYEAESRVQLAIASIFDLLVNNPAFYFLLLCPLLALATWAFFLNRKRNYAETLVLTLYVMAQATLLMMIARMLFMVIPESDLQVPYLGVFVFLGLVPFYAGWAYADFFSTGLVRGVVSAILLFAGFILVAIGLLALMSAQLF